MLPEHQRVLDDEICPVPDQLLGELYRSSSRGVDVLIAGVDPGVRAKLATYCYRRAHFTSIGLAIAATCKEEDLSHWAGRAGEALFARSREAPQASHPRPHNAARPKITLATGALRTMRGFEDDWVEEPTVDATTG